MGFVRFGVPCIREIVSCSILEYVRNVRTYHLCTVKWAMSPRSARVKVSCGCGTRARIKILRLINRHLKIQMAN